MEAGAENPKNLKNNCFEDSADDKDSDRDSEWVTSRPTTLSENDKKKAWDVSENNNRMTTRPRSKIRNIKTTVISTYYSKSGKL